MRQCMFEISWVKKNRKRWIIFALLRSCPDPVRAGSPDVEDNWSSAVKPLSSKCAVVNFPTVTLDFGYFFCTAGRLPFQCQQILLFTRQSFFISVSASGPFSSLQLILRTDGFLKSCLNLVCVILKPCIPVMAHYDNLTYCNKSWLCCSDSCI